jgi:threonine dehydrogenase-like Zn-dependent dehydrogenase
MGHEYAGVVKEVGTDVRTIRPGQFVVGSFVASDNSCEICQAGYQSRCVHAELIGAIGTQAEYARIPLADGTLVATPGVPSLDARQLRAEQIGRGVTRGVASSVVKQQWEAIRGHH